MRSPEVLCTTSLELVKENYNADFVLFEALPAAISRLRIETPIYDVIVFVSLRTTSLIAAAVVMVLAIAHIRSHICQIPNRFLTTNDEVDKTKEERNHEDEYQKTHFTQGLPLAGDVGHDCTAIHVCAIRNALVSNCSSASQIVC